MFACGMREQLDRKKKMFEEGVYTIEQKRNLVKWQLPPGQNVEDLSEEKLNEHLRIMFLFNELY